MTFDPNEVLRRFHRALVREIQDSNPEHLTAPFSVAEIYQNLVPYRTHRDELGVEMNADYEHALLRLLAGESNFLTIESRTARQEIREELESPNPNTGLYRDFAAADVRLNPDKIDEALMWEPTKAEGEGEDEEPGGVETSDESESESPSDIPSDDALEVDTDGDDDEPEDEDQGEDEGDDEGEDDVEDDDVEEDDDDEEDDDLEDDDDDDEASEDEVEFMEEEEEASAEPQGEVDSEDDPVDLSEEDVSWPGEVEADVAIEPVDAVSKNEDQGTETDPKPCAWCREALPDRPGVNFCPFCGCSVHLVPCPECGEELELNWRFCIACGTEVSS